MLAHWGPMLAYRRKRLSHRPVEDALCGTMDAHRPLKDVHRGRMDGDWPSEDAHDASKDTHCALKDTHGTSKDTHRASKDAHHRTVAAPFASLLRPPHAHRRRRLRLQRHWTRLEQPQRFLHRALELRIPALRHQRRRLLHYD